MRKFNGKVSDNSVQIENYQIKIRWGSAPASDLFSYRYIINGYDIYQYKETCEVLIDYPKTEGEDIKLKKGH